ncbi:MAG TPA: thermonuclease family protein [Burkholderiales bacterium]|nr:thermonuclease family protein [Burkholderiales bacterium]
MRIALAAIALLAGFACNAFAATLQGRVVGVSDGDTVTVLTAENRQLKIRLSGIDAPEKKQSFGAHAKQTLSRQVFGQPVTVEWTKTDRYGRIVGKIEAGGTDVNLEQVREGSAWVYTQYLRELPPEDRRLYLEAERQAREERRGLWHDGDPEPPWQWRREERSHRSRGG